MNDVFDYINQLTEVIVEKMDPEKVILFGSHAYGIPNKDSDIDILIILKESSLSRHKRTGLLYSTMESYFTNYSIDFVVYTNEEVKKWSNASLSFISSVIKKGKLLYERKS